MYYPFAKWLGLALGLILGSSSVTRSSLDAEDADGNSKRRRNFEDYFQSGTESYLDNDWESCVEFLEKAVASFNEYRAGQAQCRIQCNSAPSLNRHRVAILSDTDHDDGLLTSDSSFGVSRTIFYENIVKNALCLMQCEKERFGRFDNDRTPGKVKNHEIEQDFANKVPYDYLQLCYFKLGNHQHAASCAYTFLVHNPEHDIMQNNLKYYLDLPEVSFNDVKYLEAKKYQRLFFQATKSYGQEDYAQVVDKMEESLKEYFVSEEECRSLCEGHLPTSPQASFVVSIAHHYTFTLRCKVKCPYELSLGHGDVQQDLLPSYFHYLQFSYYRLNQIQKSCESVASYLALKPNDTVMLENKRFYETLDQVKPDWFTPRHEVTDYVQRYTKEKIFLKFIDKEFDFSQAANYSTVNSTKNSIKTSPLSEGQKWAVNSGIKVTMDADQLKGTKRFVADHVASQSECQQLVHLASEGATHGDGYNGKLSPHTEFETFEGLTVGRAVTLAHKGLIDPLEAQLFLKASEKARKYIEIHFNLTSPLYFAYTHLVCRTSLSESSTRNDLSHPVHADNCLLTKEGECLKQRPAYTWRDYSAILYLNDDFQGGEFIFAKSKDAVESSVKPRCGRMVGFSAGKENLHGVQAVVKGRRCALAMWYTLDARYQEKERTIAEQAIAELVRNKMALKDVPNLSPPTTNANGNILKPPKSGGGGGGRTPKVLAAPPLGDLNSQSKIDL